MRRILIPGLLVVALAVSPVLASCSPDKQFGQISPGIGYFYTHMGDTTLDPASVIAHFWSSDAYSGNNNGAYDDSQWFLPWPDYAPDAFYLNGFLGYDGVTGCPSNYLTVLINDKTPDGKRARFLVTKVTETFTTSLGFDWALAFGADLNTAPMPKVRVMNTGPCIGNTSTVDLIVSASEIEAGIADATGLTSPVVAVNLYKAVTSSEPGRLHTAPGWVLVGSFPYAGANVSFPTQTATSSTWFAASIVVEGGTTDMETEYLGQSAWINCDLAEPGGKEKKPKKDKHNP